MRDAGKLEDDRAPPALQQSCYQCGTTDAKLQACAACRHALFCSKACQKAAWPQHKPECLRAQALEKHKEGARSRSLAKQQIREAQRLRMAAVGDGDAMQAEAMVLSAIELLCALPAGEQSMGLLSEAALELAATMGGRAETAALAERELEKVIASPGWDATSGHASEVRNALEEVRGRVPLETRRCNGCAERRPKDAFSENQWRKGKRRCKLCQERGIVTTVEARKEQEAAQAEAEAFRKIHDQIMAAERQRVVQELARRNANEHTDAECPICFDECEAADRRALHGEMHWMCKGCLGEMLSRPPPASSDVYMCPTCRHALDAPRLRAGLS
jgi:hypothetical protein